MRVAKGRSERLFVPGPETRSTDWRSLCDAQPPTDIANGTAYLEQPQGDAAHVAARCEIGASELAKIAAGLRTLELLELIGSEVLP